MTTPDKATEIKGAIAAVLAFMTALWGWLGWAVLIWFFCLLLDYISGSAAARRNGDWSSAIAREGLWHKLGEIFAVVVASMCDITLTHVMGLAPISLPFELGPLITPLVLLWYTLTELGSILENAGKLGAKYPTWLKKMLKQYKENIEHSMGEHDAEHPPDEAASKE